MPSISMKLGRENSTFGFFSAQHQCAGTIAEEHAGGAIFPIENSAECLCADHQRFLALPERSIESATDKA